MHFLHFSKQIRVHANCGTVLIRHANDQIDNVQQGKHALKVKFLWRCWESWKRGKMSETCYELCFSLKTFFFLRLRSALNRLTALLCSAHRVSKKKLASCKALETRAIASQSGSQYYLTFRKSNSKSEDWSKRSTKYKLDSKFKKQYLFISSVSQHHWHNSSSPWRTFLFIWQFSHSFLWLWTARRKPVHAEVSQWKWVEVLDNWWSWYTWLTQQQKQQKRDRQRTDKAKPKKENKENYITLRGWVRSLSWKRAKKKISKYMGCSV